MAVQRTRVRVTRAISGQDWIAAGREGRQDWFWDAPRNSFWHDMVAGGWHCDDEPQETIEYDEERGLVMLHIRAVAEREVDMSPIDYGDWTAIGHLAPGQGFSLR